MAIYYLSKPHDVHTSQHSPIYSAKRPQFLHQNACTIVSFSLPSTFTLYRHGESHHTPVVHCITRAKVKCQLSPTGSRTRIPDLAGLDWLAGILRRNY